MNFIINLLFVFVFGIGSILFVEWIQYIGIL